MKFLTKIEQHYEVTANVYYVTVDKGDFEYNHTLDAAKNSALNALKKFPNGVIKIEVYRGQQHGSGGALLKTFQLNNQTKKFEACPSN